MQSVFDLPFGPVSTEAGLSLLTVHSALPLQVYTYTSMVLNFRIPRKDYV